ncbi:hypothetical protein, partial [Methanoculleus chikugoensis]|uniref:hypothetical protein n=1 Tax=Methanoculleus chikugoensis TaxID=118126 RepID=UPI001FB1E47C
MTAFAAPPDCSYEVFSAAVAAAEREILVNVYEFTDEKMTEDLISARKRGGCRDHPPRGRAGGRG